MSKRLNITLPDSVCEDLVASARSQGRPTANLAAFLVEWGLKGGSSRTEAKEAGRKA